MRKILPLVLVIIIIGGVLAAFMLTRKDSNSRDSSSQQSSSSTPNGASDTENSSSFKSVKACDVLTLDDAKRVLGSNAQPGDTTANTIVENSEMTLTSCSFLISDGAIPPNSKVASLQARSAKTQIGATSNKSPFGPGGKPANVQDISNLGELAYWNPEFGQLSIFKNNNYYIIQVGNPNKASERTVADSKKLADIIIDRL